MVLAYGRGPPVATSLIAGRVDEETKERADFFIRRAGLKQSDVIRIVWGNIARTGEVPRPSDAETPHDTLVSRFKELRAKTPRSAHLEDLSPEKLKEELSNRG